MGVPGPTRHSSSLSSGLALVRLLVCHIVKVLRFLAYYRRRTQLVIDTSSPCITGVFILDAIRNSTMPAANAPMNMTSAPS